MTKVCPLINLLKKRCRELNPGRLGDEKLEHCLSALPPRPPKKFTSKLISAYLLPRIIFYSTSLELCPTGFAEPLLCTRWVRSNFTVHWLGKAPWSISEKGMTRIEPRGLKSVNSELSPQKNFLQNFSRPDLSILENIFNGSLNSWRHIIFFRKVLLMAASFLPRLSRLCSFFSPRVSIKVPYLESETKEKI